MQSPEEARRIAEALIERGIAAGATAADALYIGERSSGVQVRLGKLEDVGRSEGEQIGLRLFDGQRSATVASSDLSAEALGVLAHNASDNDLFALTDVTPTTLDRMDGEELSNRAARVLAAANEKKTDLATFYGGVKFADDGSNPGKEIVMRQIQGGKYVVVSPAEVAVAPLTYPRDAHY